MGREFVTDGDFMEIENLHLVPIKDGKFLDLETQEIIDPEDDDGEEDETPTSETD